jgi:hypothetical protein
MTRQRWLLWSIFVLVWTIGLLYPFPPPDEPPVGSDELPLRYIAAKVLHVLAYAAMAFLSGWLKVPLRWRWLLVFFLMAHASVTEMGQAAMRELHWAQRTGKLTDVGLDHLGVLIGLLLSWKWWVDDKE